ncbi:MAG: hypothetical protein JXA71_15035 [Chitinispirillaceae bacterium]|nr:hypothetical protein [Chitinispirillaceae bacterium]
MVNHSFGRWIAAIGVISIVATAINAATFTVAKDGSGQYNTIMAAVRVAKAGDSVRIMDLATYAEQVIIDSTKTGLILCSRSPTSFSKPRIVYRDLVNVGPRNYQESLIDSLITFDRNGALQILAARNVVIDGIAVDGGGPYSFGYPAIWNNRDALQHGNGAIALWMCGGIHIKNCSISNAYFGINFKDRNQGGIFGNPNPADNEPWRVVPLSGYGKTGNHIIEYNRIHHNSVGMFFESSWDLGSTIRYNLIYENHHHSDAFATEVKAKTSDGGNQPGGALMFKDVMLSPLAIYNNTFWHNFLEMIGHWKTGYQHLVFNNIYGAPYRYFNVETIANATYMDICKCLPNRMNNCIFAAHQQAPNPSYVAIFNNFQPQAVNNQILPGALVVGGTPAWAASADIRWLETPFLSTDTASANFLVPDWSDPSVQSFIINKGWEASGVRDPDGSRADLGAIPQGGGRAVDVATIIPPMPVMLSNTTSGSTATVTFALLRRGGSMTAPTIKMHRWISNLPYDNTAWSSNWAAGVITAANVNTIAAPATPVAVGSNSYTFRLPVAQTTSYAFLEMIIEGTGSNSLPYTSTVGFIPYRKLDYYFLVEILDRNTSAVLTQVHAGDTVALRVRAYSADGTIFSNPISNVDIILQSGFQLLTTTTDPATPLVVIALTGAASGYRNNNVMFTRVPVGDIEIVSARGSWTDGTNTLPFGCRPAIIKILPGPPDSVVFQNPPSVKFQAATPIIDPGIPYNGLLYVYDRFGNRADQPTAVNLSSLNSTIGNIVGTAPVTITTDTTGSGIFQVEVTNGSMGQIFSIRADLPGKQPDTARLKVGAPRDRLWIFFGDTAAYDPTVRLQGTVGERLPVVIMCGKVANLDSAVATANFTFSVLGATAGLEFYASSAAATSATSFSLVNGRATVWVTSSVAISNGQFAVSPDTVNTVQPSDPRDKIYFVKPAVVIDSAFYYTDNGFGRVDRVEVYYKDTLAFVPDSMIFYWPSKITPTPNRRVVTAAGGGMTLAADKRHLTVTLATPFPAEITAGSTGENLGASWNRSNAAPTLPAEETPFRIQDRVGPLAMRALLVERLGGGAGTDTLYVSFSESIVPASLVGASLILIKAGAESQLTVSAATAAANNNYRLVVTGTVAPAEGDSLRLQPGGPITDSTVWLNTPHLSNRPVVIGIKPVPATILSAYYQDRDANGHVDHVVLRFAKKVALVDCIIELDFGVPPKIDSVATGRLSAVVTPGSPSDSIVDANIAGLFTGISYIKTGGNMKATVSYRSIPGESVSFGNVADSAAPVLIDSATYFPGKALSATESDADTLRVHFSESINSAQLKDTPFKLFSALMAAPYTFTVNPSSIVPAGLVSNGGRAYKMIVSSGVNPAAIRFPRTGDSLWINQNGGIRDSGLVVQNKEPNHKVKLFVVLKQDIQIILSSNPFVINQQFDLANPRISGSGVAVIIKPLGAMGDLSNITEASITIYDVLGNIVLEKTKMSQNIPENVYAFNWNGQNRNNRMVGTGTYAAVITTVRTNKQYRDLVKIGVKR